MNPNHQDIEDLIRKNKRKSKIITSVLIFFTFLVFAFIFYLYFLEKEKVNNSLQRIEECKDEFESLSDSTETIKFFSDSLSQVEKSKLSVREIILNY